LKDPSDSDRRSIRFAAVGDLLLTSAPEGTLYDRQPELVATDIREMFSSCDLVFGNLECTLAGNGPCVETEPLVIATPEMVRWVKSARFDVVTLANNHTFDHLDRGFRNLRSLLKELDLPNFGAGMNLQEAAAPAILERGGYQVAFLGAVDERSGPYQFAGPNHWGVAPLDIDRLTGQIRDLRAQVNHVIVSVHWGEERFFIPSPTQIDQAHALIDAGASMVLGHHPHVVQGLEMHGGSPILYSLGNIVADEVHFSNGDKVQWNRTERIGCLLLANLNAHGVSRVRQLPTYDSGRLVEIDHSDLGQRRIDQTNRAVATGITLRQYRREHLWVKTLKPALNRLHWRRVKDLRFRHFHKALGQVLRSKDAE
jgi:poly-gamma-glutamate capsule biosynthesis protein CapA/YwtB (metallophosphatase superfamily)